MTPRTRRPLAVILLLAALLLAADTLAWLQMQRLLDRRLAALVQDAAKSGWQLDIAPGRRGGWPFAATRTLPGVRLHGGEALAAGGIVWSGERITASLSLLHPQGIGILTDGTQVISAGNAGLARSLRFWGTRIGLRLPFRSGTLATRLSFDAQALRVALPGAGPDDVVTVAGLDGKLRWTSEARALTLDLQGIGLPAALPQAAGLVIPAGSLEASLIGALGSRSSSLTDRLRGWQEGGGRLMLRRAAIHWPDGGIDGSGQMSLDGNLLADGGFVVGITGADALLDRLAKSGRVTVATASAVHAVLGLIVAGQVHPEAPGPARPLELPLTLHAGLLSLGQIPLLRIARFLPVGALP